MEAFRTFKVLRFIGLIPLLAFTLGADCCLAFQCGYPIPGDINCNGTIDWYDVSTMEQLLCGGNIDFGEPFADVDGDARLGPAEYMYSIEYTSGARSKRLKSFRKSSRISTILIGPSGPIYDVFSVKIKVDSSDLLSSAIFTASYDTANIQLNSIGSSFFISYDFIEYPGTGARVCAGRVNDNNPVSNVEILTLNFQFTDTASVGVPFEIAIMPTELWNTMAGYMGEELDILYGSDLDSSYPVLMSAWEAGPPYETVSVMKSEPPPPTIDGPIVTNNSMVTWNWNASTTSNLFRWKIDDADFSSGAVETGSTQWTLNMSDGNHIFYVQEKYGDNNWTDSGTFSTVVDTGKPCSIASSISEVMGSTSISVEYEYDDIFFGESCGNSSSGSGLSKIELWSLKPGDSGYTLSVTDTSGLIDGLFEYNFEPMLFGDYQFYTLSYDRAGNVEAIPQQGYDTQTNYRPNDYEPPEVTLTNPSQNSKLTTLNQISGSASDASSGLNYIELKISDNDPIRPIFFTKEQGVSNTETWIRATGTESWYFDTPFTNWGLRPEYSITARAVDNAGNSNETQINFKYGTNDLTLSPSTSILEIKEPDGFFDFTIRLTDEPIYPVDINIGRSDITELTVTPAYFQIQPQNWETPVPVRIQAYDDGKNDGAQTCSVNIRATSLDESFNEIEKNLLANVSDVNTCPLIIEDVYPAVGVFDQPTEITIRGMGLNQITNMKIYLMSPEGNMVVDEIYNTTITSKTDSKIEVTIPSLPSYASDEANYAFRFYCGISSATDKKNACTLYQTLPEFKAVIVAGMDTDNSALWTETKINAHRAYNVLLDRGYQKKNIKYLSSETNVDIDQDDVEEEIEDPTVSNLQEIILDWAGDTGTAYEELVIYMTGHGGTGFFRINPDETLSSDALNTWLDSVQSQIDGELFLIYDACRSGTFLPPLSSASPARTIITGAGDHTAYFFDETDLSFSSAFWSNIDIRQSVGTSFQNAKKTMERFQTPLMDSDGDDDSDVDDLLIAENVFIGRGGIPASDVPVVNEVTSTFLSADSARIRAASVTDSDGIGNVWAIVTGPCHRFGLPKSSLEEEFFTAQADKSYVLTLENLFITGTYTVSIYASDIHGYKNTDLYEISIENIGNTFCGVTADLDQDGTPELEEAITILKSLTGIDTTYDMPQDYADLGIDVDGDLIPGLPEVVYILQHAAEIR